MILERFFVYKFIAHSATILKHKGYAFYYCCKSGLYLQGIVHDLSKFSLEEFIPGIMYYTGECSPNSIQKKKKGTRQRGCIIKAETSIIMNTGWITRMHVIKIREKKYPQSRCRQSIWLRCFAIG